MSGQNILDPAMPVYNCSSKRIEGSKKLTPKTRTSYFQKGNCAFNISEL